MPAEIKLANVFVCSEVYVLAPHDQLKLFEYYDESKAAVSLSKFNAFYMTIRYVSNTVMYMIGRIRK